MNRILFSIILILFFLFSCQPSLENILPSTDQNWAVEAIAYELSWDFNLINSQITQDNGQVQFLENGRGFWDNGRLRIKTDTIRGDSFRWAANDDRIELRFDLDQEDIDQEERQRFEFQVLESSREQQIWRYENEFKVYDPQKRDSAQGRIVWQWQLGRN